VLDFTPFINKQVFITCAGFRVSGVLVEYISAEDGGHGGAELEVDTPFGRRNFYTKSVERIELLAADHPALAGKDMYPAPRLDLDIAAFLDKTVRVICVDGTVTTGKVIDWTSNLDNEPDGESIGLKDGDYHVEVFVEDIVSIEVLEAARSGAPITQ
jgi:hypothetical protein